MEKKLPSFDLGCSFPLPSELKKKKRKEKEELRWLPWWSWTGWLRRGSSCKDDQTSRILYWNVTNYTTSVYGPGIFLAYPDVYYHYTDLTHPYIYRIQLSTRTVYAPRKGPYTEFFIQCNGPAVLTSLSLGQCSKASVWDLPVATSLSFI